ncbi:MAG: Pycsar system effector family protein [Pseudonocardiaceae bacterium]
MHEALIGWTGKVDSKAGFALSAEVAVLAATVGLIAPDRIFANFRSPWIAALFYTGCTFMLCAVLTAACAVVPRIYSRDSGQQSQINFIYFGNLRCWDPTKLAHVMNEQDPLPALSHQLVNISRIVWIKHRYVQFSLWFAAAGGVALVATGLFS